MPNTWDDKVSVFLAGMMVGIMAFMVVIFIVTAISKPIECNAAEIQELEQSK